MACVTPQSVRRAPKAALHGMQREGKSSLSGSAPDELSNSKLDWSRANANTAVASSSESSALVVAGTVQRSLCCKEKTVWPSRVRRGKVLLAWHGPARQTAVRWWGAVPLKLAVAGASSLRVQRLRAVFEATVLQLRRLLSTAERRTACGGPASGGCPLAT